MSGVDVLAVMDRAAGGLFAARGSMPNGLMQARAAVEKLIADRAELLEALTALLARADAVSEQAGTGWWMEQFDARAAIARATGGGNE